MRVPAAYFHDLHRARPRAREVLAQSADLALQSGAVIFPTYGGRFGYSPATCRELAANARPALAVPAAGITLNRIGELLDFYGPDTMLLIGGNLLLARDRITEESRAFAEAVARHGRPTMDSEQPPTSGPRATVSGGTASRTSPTSRTASAPFKDISRQVLFHEAALGCELRYFEMEANGYSTLERHEHAHAVMILRGHGQCMVGTEVRAVKPRDLVTIPAWTWHQFRATVGESLRDSCAW